MTEITKGAIEILCIKISDRASIIPEKPLGPVNAVNNPSCNNQEPAHTVIASVFLELAGKILRPRLGPALPTIDVDRDPHFIIPLLILFENLSDQTLVQVLQDCRPAHLVRLKSRRILIRGMIRNHALAC